MPAGRPTDYTPSLGSKILSLMSEGLSLAAAAAEIGIHRQRVYEWEQRHPKFADTVKLARVKRQLFLERRLLSAKDSPVVTSTIFALKNAGAEDWREKQEIEHSGNLVVDHRDAAKREVEELFGPTAIEVIPNG
jgi:transposase